MTRHNVFVAEVYFIFTLQLVTVISTVGYRMKGHTGIRVSLVMSCAEQTSFLMDIIRNWNLLNKIKHKERNCQYYENSSYNY